jgi:TRAP-type transport system periplasmic protein
MLVNVARGSLVDEPALVELRLAHAGSETDSRHIAILEFAKRVKERTNGGIEVRVFPGSSLGPDAHVGFDTVSNHLP